MIDDSSSAVTAAAMNQQDQTTSTSNHNKSAWELREEAKRTGWKRQSQQSRGGEQQLSSSLHNEKTRTSTSSIISPLPLSSSSDHQQRRHHQDYDAPPPPPPQLAPPVTPLRDRVAMYSMNVDALSSSIHTATDILQEENQASDTPKRSSSLRHSSHGKVSNTSAATPTPKRSSSLRNSTYHYNPPTSSSRPPATPAKSRSLRSSAYRYTPTTPTRIHHHDTCPQTTGGVGGGTNRYRNSAAASAISCLLIDDDKKEQHDDELAASSVHTAASDILPPRPPTSVPGTPQGSNYKRRSAPPMCAPMTTGQVGGKGKLRVSTSALKDRIAAFDHDVENRMVKQICSPTPLSPKLSLSDHMKSKLANSPLLSSSDHLRSSSHHKTLSPIPRKLNVKWPPVPKTKNGKKKQRSMVELSSIDSDVVKSRRTSYEPSLQQHSTMTSTSDHNNRHSILSSPIAFHKKRVTSASSRKRANIRINYDGPTKFTVDQIATCLDCMGQDSIRDFHPNLLLGGHDDNSDFAERLHSGTTRIQIAPIRNDSFWYTKNKTRRPDIWVTPLSSAAKTSYRVKRVWNVEQWDEKEVEHTVEHEDLMSTVKSLLGALPEDDSKSWTAQWIYDVGGQIIDDDDEDDFNSSTEFCTEEELSNVVNGTWIFGQGEGEETYDDFAYDDASRFSSIRSSTHGVTVVGEDSPLEAQWIYGEGDEDNQDYDDTKSWGGDSGHESKEKEEARAAWIFGDGEDDSNDDDNMKPWGEAAVFETESEPVDAKWTYGNSEEPTQDGYNSKSWGESANDESTKDGTEHPLEGQWTYGNCEGNDEEPDINQWGGNTPVASNSLRKNSNAKCKNVFGSDEEETEEDRDSEPLQSNPEEETRPRNRRTYKIKKTTEVLPDESGHSALTESTADTEDSSTRLDDKIPEEEPSNNDVVSRKALTHDVSTTEEPPLKDEPLESIPAPVFDKSLKLMKKKKKEKKTRCSMMDLLDPPKFTTIVFNEY